MVKQWFKHRVERFWCFVAWKLPASLCVWVLARMTAYATTGKYSGQIMSELTALECMKRWQN